MTIEHFPDIAPSSCGFNVLPASSLRRNPFSNVEDPISKEGAYWKVSLTWAFLTRAQVKTLRSALLALDGQVGRIYISDFAHQNEGSWSGAPVVNGAGQYGRVLTVKGVAASSQIAPAGDRFTLNGRMHELIKPAVSDIYGHVTLSFRPELLVYPDDNQPLILEKPYSKFILSDPSQIPTFSQANRGLKNVTIGFVESLRP